MRTAAQTRTHEELSEAFLARVEWTTGAFMSDRDAAPFIEKAGEFVSAVKGRPASEFAEELRRIHKATRPTVRNAIIFGRHGRYSRKVDTSDMELATFSDYAEDTETETNFRYGRDFNDAKDFASATLVSHRYLSGSDYSGGTVVKANQKAVEEMGGDAVQLRAHGGHETLQVWFRLDVRTSDADTIAEMLAGLSNYPCVDDEALSELEHETASQDWDSYGRSDFLRSLETEHGLERDSLDIEAESLDDIFRVADSDGALTQHEESPGTYFDTDKAAERTSAALLFYTSKPSLDFEETSALWVADPGEGYRLLRLFRIGQTLRKLATETGRILSRGSDMEQGRKTAHDAIMSAKFDAGDTSASLDAEAMARVVDRSFSLTVSRWIHEPSPSFGRTVEMVLTLDPCDSLAAYPAAETLAAFLSKRD